MNIDEKKKLYQIDLNEETSVWYSFSANTRFASHKIYLEKIECDAKNLKYKIDQRHTELSFFVH